MTELEQGKFSQLSAKEVHNKLLSISSSKKSLQVWQKGHEAFSSKLKDATLEGHLELCLFNEDAREHPLESEYYLNFSDGNLEYFLIGTVFKAGPDEFWLNIQDEIFRREKRIEERLLTYPHRQSYLYFKQTDHDVEGSENVIFLSKDGGKKTFKTKEGMSNLPEEMKGQREELIGFRVLDISSEGVSALASHEEVLFFNHSDSIYSYKILLEGKTFTITGSELVYKVDYMNPRVKNSSHYKIGFKFNQDEEVKSLIEKVIEESNTFQERTREFENFIKDE
ncbi:MAG: hypothetical protein HN509_05000 [Halobacteriovoraceae bacterium]|jgi:hypothetical protein|nr:hypothetical protein [Halobacteriovoraceae bacterium]MBT5094738.1 hypothetical protein [Halobacteriovoraceae bacterium]